MDYVYEYYITVISTQASIGVHMLLACSVLCCNAMHRSAVNRECYDMLLYMPPTHMRTHTHRRQTGTVPSGAHAYNGTHIPAAGDHLVSYMSMHTPRTCQYADQMQRPV